MKIRLVALFFFLSTVLALAQKHFVVGSSGGVFTATSGSLEWTVGEISTETFQKSPGFLTQGFHQTFSEGSNNSIEISVYPNPSEDFLFIKTPIYGNYQIEIFNLYGIRVVDGNFTSDSNSNIHQLDVHNLSAALYQIRVRNNTTGKSKAFKIILL